MSKFKKIISICLIMTFAVILVGCNKNSNNNNNNNPSENNPPAENVITTRDVLGLIFENVNNKLTKSNKENVSSFAEYDGKTFYNDYIYAGLSILKEISSYENLEEEKVISSSEFTLNCYENNYANKVDKFYIKNKKNAYQNNIEIYMICSRIDYYTTNPMDSVMLFYDIFYDENTEKYNITFKIEKSNAKQSDSSSHYYIFSYNSVVDEVQAYSFYREIEIDLTNKNLLTSNLLLYIKAFKIINYSILLDYNYPFTSEEIDLKNIDVQNLICKEILSLQNLRNIINNFEVEENNTSTIFTEKLLYIVNASRIVDFEDNTQTTN